MKSIKGIVGYLLLGAVLAGCAEGSFSPDEGSQLVATVESPDGTSVEFISLGDGGVIVKEHGPSESLSPVMYLVGEWDATPLEVYLALDPEATAPLELLEAHETVMEARGGAIEPRKLHLPDPSFRLYQDHYAANCLRSADQSWFNDSVSALGMNWSNYQGSVSVTLSPIFSGMSPATNSFITHVCNYSVKESNSPYADYPVHQTLYTDAGVYSFWNGSYWQQVYNYNIYPGERALIWVSGDPDQYRALINSGTGLEGYIRIGAMSL